MGLATIRRQMLLAYENLALARPFTKVLGRSHFLEHFFHHLPAHGAYNMFLK